MVTKFGAGTPKYAIPHTNVVFFFCSMHIVLYAPDFNLLQMRVFMLIFQLARISSMYIFRGNDKIRF